MTDLLDEVGAVEIAKLLGLTDRVDAGLAEGGTESDVQRVVTEAMEQVGRVDPPKQLVCEPRPLPPRKRHARARRSRR